MKYLIKGLTKSGSVFRPSDWSDRLCSMLAHYRPGTKPVSVVAEHTHKMQGYSTYIMPTFSNGIKSVVLDSRLKDIEILAFEFVLNFANDNDLVVEEYIEDQVLDLAEAA